MVNVTTQDPDTEQRILDAAHAVIVRRGTAGARMQEIADEAGVNKALLHYYFRSKERLADAVFLRAAKRLMPPVIAILGSDRSLEEKVEHVVAHYAETLTVSPYLPGYILSELQHHPERVPAMLARIAEMPMDAFVPRVLAKLRAQIAERVEAGSMRPIGAEHFMANLMSMCIFPFAARPMMKLLFSLDDAGFAAFVETRKRELPGFFLAALRP
jgi:TetR/AcrR family transcriptional regulator